MKAYLTAMIIASATAAMGDEIIGDGGDPVEGAGLFQAYCAACHGATAEGDGPMAELLTVVPPDLTGIAAANGGVFPTLRVVSRIDGRDALLAHGGAMPLFGEFFQGEGAAVRSETGQPIMTTQPIADLAAWLAEVQG